MNLRPDLALTYYPSVYNFYWFVARNVKYLNQFKDMIKYPEQEECRQLLTNIMRTEGTKQLLQLAKKDGDDVYWEQFLGIYGKKDR